MATVLEEGVRMTLAASVTNVPDVEGLPDLVRLTVRTGINYDISQPVYVNRRLVTHVSREREYRAQIAEPEYTAVHLLNGQMLKVVESLQCVAAALS
jgi:hypothetical protein